MIRNYFLIAIRNLWRHRLITVINLVGMALGFGIFLTFWSWVRLDMSFDRFHEDIDRMYVLNVRLTMNGSEYTSQRTGGIFASVLPENFPQILGSCRVSEPLEFEFGIPAEKSEGDVPMRYFNEDEVLAVDTSFLQFFTFNLVKGDLNQVFTERDHLVITESLARKIFGEEDPMNREIRIGEGGYFRVAGIVEDPPLESTFQFTALLGFHIMEELGYPVDGSGGTMYYSNFKLAPGTDLAVLNPAINEYIEGAFDIELDSYFFLDRLTRMHLHGESKGMIGFIINMIMSLMILSIACINFINLTTAYASSRIKEISIRKSAGASKGQLVVQYMGETYLLLLLAFYLGLFFAEHLVPVSYRSFGIEREADFTGLSFWLQVLAIYLVTGVMAGLYPAVRIAGFRPLAFLTGKNMAPTHGGSRSRKVLIVVQFSFSVIFIIVTIFMIRQYAYLKEADLGFNREDLLYIRTTGRVWEVYPQIKQELSELHFVEGVTTGSSIPVMINHGEIDWGEREGDHNRIAVILWTDADFLSTFEINLLKGAYFREGSDSLNHQCVVVNQSLVELMGWEDPVGRDFYLWGRDFQVLGVTENINFFPFNLGVFEDRALIYLFDPVREYIFIRVNQEILPEQVVKIEAVFRKYNPGYEFIYDLVSEYEYEALENADGIGLIFKLFSFVAIFIAVLGLIGLSLYNSNRRTKEVGIRKVMGADTGVIMRLLLSDFIKLVVLSNLIAIPLAYLLVKRLLNIFSYCVELKASVFVGVFLFSVCLSLITVVYHAFRTARSNPADSLRYE
jgi:putative ABC transport system permease protein